ncbi:MAG: hypothetical protein IJB69_02300 [Clostridia bacterium]|nr:hypothetical protein [Clostridia bacterium]
MKMNKIVAVLMLVVMAFALTACGAKQQSVVGKWEMDMNAVMEMMGVSEEEMALVQALASDMSATMEFTKDGKCILEMTAMGQSQTQEQEYVIEDGKIVLEGSPADYKVEGDKLSITADGITMVLTKVK